MLQLPSSSSLPTAATAARPDSAIAACLISTRTPQPSFQRHTLLFVLQRHTPSSAAPTQRRHGPLARPNDAASSMRIDATHLHLLPQRHTPSFFTAGDTGCRLRFRRHTPRLQLRRHTRHGPHQDGQDRHTIHCHSAIIGDHAQADTQPGDLASPPPARSLPRRATAASPAAHTAGRRACRTRAEPHAHAMSRPSKPPHVVCRAWACARWRLAVVAPAPCSVLQPAAPLAAVRPGCCAAGRLPSSQPSS